MIRANLAAILRRLGRAMFRAADRLHPDWISLALDEAYAPPADEARAWSGESYTRRAACIAAMVAVTDADKRGILVRVVDE